MGASLQSGARGTARGRSRAYRPMSEINVTPFVDVMLVLLVVFMITAPLLTAGVKIDLPQSEAKSVSEEDKKPLEISMDSKGQLYVGETEVKRERLVTLLSSMTKNDPERRIFLHADRSLSYGQVMEVLGALNGAGFAKVALISESL